MMISVIVPVYSRSNLLIDCIESILGQTYRNIQLILVDDGSPDNCGQICDGYAKKDERITVIHKENGGVATARNAGLEMACGDWLYFLDADDYLEPDALNSIIAKANETRADLVFFDTMEFTYGKGMRKGALNTNKDYFDELYDYDVFKVFLGMENSVWSFIVKTDRIKGIFRFREDIHYTDDAIFRLECYPNIGSFAYLKKAVHNRRLSVGNYSQSRQEYNKEVKFLIIQAHLGLLNKYDYPDNATGLINARLINVIIYAATSIFDKRSEIHFSQKVFECEEILSLDSMRCALLEYDRDILSKSAKLMMIQKIPSPYWLYCVCLLLKSKQYMNSILSVMRRASKIHD